jgi:hypothetical protein
MARINYSLNNPDWFAFLSEESTYAFTELSIVRSDPLAAGDNGQMVANWWLACGSLVAPWGTALSITPF